MREAENAPSLEQMLGNTAWIKALARRLVSEPSAADDLIQDAYVAALRRPPLDPDAWTPWLRRVLGNFARLRHRERVNRAKRETAVARPERVTADPQAVLERAEIQKRLTELVLELPEPYRSTVLLRFFEGLSPREIAEAQGTPVTTVRSRLTEALDRLRERLDRSSGGDREAWRLALLPIAGGTALATLGGGKVAAAASAAPGATPASAAWLDTTLGMAGTIMTTKGIVTGAAGAILLAAGIGIVLEVQGPDGSAAIEPATASTAARLRDAESDERVAVATPAPPIPAESRGPSAASPGSSDALAAGEETDGVSTLVEIIEIFEQGGPGPEFEITAEDLERTLDKHGRDPGFLEVAALLTGDGELARAYLAEALEKEPDSPGGLLALLDLQRTEGESAADILSTIEALEAADPTNGLPRFYAAALKIEAGDLAGALEDIRAAASRPRINNYDARRFPLLQSFHEDKGNPPAVAKVLAMSGTRNEEGRLIPAVARGLSGEATRLLAENRIVESLAYSRAGVDLARKLAGSAHSIVEEVLAGFVERTALTAEREARQRTGDEARIREIDERLLAESLEHERGKKLAGIYLEALKSLDEEEAARFFHRFETEGEAAAALGLQAVREALAGE